MQWAPSWGREGGKAGARLEFQTDLDCPKSQEHLEEFGQTLFSSVIDASSCEISLLLLGQKSPRNARSYEICGQIARGYSHFGRDGHTKSQILNSF